MSVVAAVTVSVLDGPLPAHAPLAPCDGAGAVVLFEGVVRGTEGERLIEALEYEVYEPMASRELGLLASDMLAAHGVLAMHVWHSRGRVPVGQCSFRLEVWSAHRAEGLQAADEFIQRMKRDVPIWKRAVVARA